MNFLHNSTLKIWLSGLAVATTLVGCANATPEAQRQPATPPNQTAPQGAEQEEAAKQTPAERQPHPAQVQGVRDPKFNVRAPKVGQTSPVRKMNNRELATLISKSVTRIPGVERAYVVVTGKTALVGVDLDAKISGSKIDTIKYAVKETAENTQDGMRAIVSADLDTVTRIRSLAAGTRGNRPVDSFADEIADIMSRLIPEM